MSDEVLLLLGLGVVAFFVLGRPNRVAIPVNAAGGGLYIPPQQAVPTYGGWPTPGAPGASAWGLIPPTPTDAQQAAQVIGAIGGLAQGVGSIIGAANSGSGSSSSSSGSSDQTDYSDLL